MNKQDRGMVKNLYMYTSVTIVKSTRE